MYKLITNLTPSDASTRAGAVIGGHSDTLRPAGEVNPQVTPAVSEVLRKGMAIAAEQRYASAAEMRQALKDASQFISFRDAQTIIQRKPSRSPLMRAGIVTAWIGIALISGYFIYAFINRSRSRTTNPASIYTATPNTSANTSIASIPASSSNQASNVAVVPSPTPSPLSVKNLEGTEWKGKRFGAGNAEYEETFKFYRDGTMQSLQPGYIFDGTWTIQGDKVLMTQYSSFAGTYKIEGTIQGNEMSGEFSFNTGVRERFLLYKTK